MLSEYEKNWIMYWLHCYGMGDPTEEFWNKASHYGAEKTMYAIRKAAQEDNCSMRHVTDIIGQVAKEGRDYVYTQPQRPPVHETISLPAVGRGIE